MHMKINATNFQTGLLRISVLYGCVASTVTANEANSQFMTFIDLKEGKREYLFTFEFPSTTQFKLCSSTHRNDLDGPTAQQIAVGTVYAHVENRLTAGGGAANNVHIQCFFSGPELEYFWLRPAQVVAVKYVPSALEKPRKFTKQDYHGFLPHAAVGDVMPQGTLPQGAATKPGVVIGTKPKIPPTLQLNVEMYTSFRDLIRRYVRYAFYTQNNGTANAVGTQNLWNDDTQTNQILSLYGVWRGNMRWKIISYRTGNALAAFNISYYRPVGSTINGPGTQSSFQAFWHQDNGSASSDNCDEIETSFVSHYNFLQNPAMATTSDLEYADSGDLCTFISYTAAAGSTSTCSVLWAGGDDFRCALLYGPYQCTVRRYRI